MPSHPDIAAFFDEATNTVSYLVVDPHTRCAAVIDPVLDFDAASGTAATRSAGQILDAASEQRAEIAWVLETHVHADHLSAARFFRDETGAKVGIGAEICAVQREFCALFHADDCQRDGTDFDRLFEDGETLPLGELTVAVMATPGHTPACVSYRIGDAVFVGDTLFMPDYGTARCDFPGGCARQLYRSMQRILALPSETRLFMCHDYKAPGRDRFAWETTVAEERANNVHLGGGVSEDDFVAMRRARDAKLSVPKLLLPAIQVNMRAGRFPPPEQGATYLRIPVTMQAVGHEV
jgi:glyoxylase-like metal-dependent hydrolase (beta-lactamase superfamily II)